MRTLVSLDIETTGLDADRDTILEIGVVRFTGEEVEREWSALINPGRPIPQKIVELTGITDEMARREGIPLWDALREAQGIVGSAPIIGHNIGFDLNFLRRQRAFVQNESVDTFELAAILVPHAGRYSLGALAAELGIALPATHRALDDARVAHHLYLRVFERAVELSRDTLDEITRHAEKLGWPLASFWREALETQARGAFTTAVGARARRKGTRGAVADPAAVLRRKQLLMAKPLKPIEDPQPLDEDFVAEILGEGGAFAQQVPNYEVRPQQVDMARKVVQAFNTGAMALIEAGTGTGKSFAYLIPAMLWAMQNSARVVISTNTINLQEQLMEKDVPLVSEVLARALAERGTPEVEARAAVMKGKGRYACPSRIDDLRRGGPRSLEEARLLAKILIWQPNTVSGDADELFMPSPIERAAFHYLSAQSPACNMNTCSANDCYFFQARRLAESAHVVIVNHALLLADIAVENRALPEYRYLVLDEGHHLESAATDSLTYAIEREDIARELDDVARGQNLRAKNAGALGDVVARVRSGLPVDRAAGFERQCELARQEVDRAHVANAAFFDELAAFLSSAGGSEPSDYSQRIRITRAVRGQGGYMQVELAFDKLLHALTALSRALNTLIGGLTEASEQMDDLDALLARLSGANRFFSEAVEQLNGIISKADEKERIYWAEVDSRERGGRSRRGGVTRVTLNTAPLHVGALLEKHLWQGKESVIMTSATIRTATPSTGFKPNFDYIRGRLRATDADTLAVGSPFDYKRSTLVYVLTDIPEPSQPGYQPALERALIELFRGSGGRGMALFTSYAALRATARVIAPELQKLGIMVYEQSDGVSRRALLEQFRASERGVLLGTRSFWEGVDIQGEKLSALAICKLPFDVPTDPVFAARSETYEDAFNEYSVPETVLRFRQGFGRLIRSKLDRGVVAVLDRRVISKGYGKAFLNSLPGPTEQRGTIAQLARATQEWLAAGDGPGDEPAAPRRSKPERS